MAQKFLTNIDLNQNQIINATFEVLATAPNSGNFEGRMYYNSTTDSIQVYGDGAWRKVVNSISSGGGAGIAEALTVSESNGTVTLTLNAADTDSAGLLPAAMWNMLTDSTDSATASKLVKRDGNGNAKVATPTDDAHIATKGYVDAARSGLDVKASVRVATTAAVTIASQLENGDVVDGITLATDDRVLVKHQSTASENGIYVVQSSGAAVRSDDANTSAEVTTGMFTFVSEGTANADTGWVLTTNDTITLGTTGLTFVQFSGAGQITAGDGLTKDGSTLNVNVTANRTAITSDAIDIASTYVGQSSITTLGTITTGIWNGTDIAVADGGTGSSNAEDARSALGLAIGSNVQAYDAELAALAGLTSAANKLPYFTGSGTAAVTDLSAHGRAIIDDADASASRTTLGLVIGTDVQAYNSTLGAVAGGTYTGDDSITTLGTIATGTWNGTDIAVADGGTGASNAADARANLGIKTSVGTATTSTPALARIASKGCAASASGTSTTTVTHLFGTKDVIVQIYEVSSGSTVNGDVTRTSIDVVTVTLLGTIEANDYTIVVTG